MHILSVSDGKAGHRSQALGLIYAMQQQSAGIQYQEVSIDDLSVFKILSARQCIDRIGLVAIPDLIVGVGSHTQLKVWLLAKIFPAAQSVIIMKPNLPLWCFDYVIVPEHDAITASQRVITTLGALNTLSNQQRHQASHLLIALGGPAKRYQWQDQNILEAVEGIICANPKAQIKLTTSRRTPSSILTQLSALQKNYANIEIFPVSQTPQGWLAEQLQHAEAAWVTEDSVSMLYEAMTAGCRVGVIFMPRLRRDRITLAIDKLLKSSAISADYNLEKLPKATDLNEAHRVAALLLKNVSNFT
ncbi:ELM1/GtrOC1 family putative glycosyltransferase [Acinetobacter larvae]|uniref:Nucleoside-diphosphate sugar epimerase n=1 Tax=Acinetobacter larvae TaxID=1789224 RepID=A0A1B2LX37_9GAMM|nr:ELM1/GtrOC1 family putative glycosyltransferase [Acinetobacter larvae]AOA57459.1 nucleoside-diphosphate sugar epimerase [Acinetobacter larvae]